HDPVAGLVAPVGRVGDGAGEVDARHVRVVAHQAALALEDHPVLEVQRRPLDVDGDVAGGEAVVVELDHLGGQPVAGLVEQQGAEHGVFVSTVAPLWYNGRMSPADPCPPVVGRVVGTDDATPLEFWVAVAPGAHIQLDDVVAVDRVLPTGEVLKVYG